MNGRKILAIDGRPANETKRAGIGNFCANLLSELTAVAESCGWQIQVYLDEAPLKSFPVDETKAEFQVLPKMRFWTHRSLAAALNKLKPTVFYAPGVQIPFLAGCPKIATIHDLAVFRYPHEFTLRRRLLARMELANARRHCSRFVAVSRTTREDAVKFLGIDESKITIALEGCSNEFRPCDNTENLNKVLLRHQLKNPYILYVGRIQPRKNLVRLMRAYEILCERCPDMPHDLVLAGAPGWMDDSVHSVSNTLKIAKRIRFLGFVQQDDLPLLMAGADVFALVSLWEGFGLPLVEAMACGIPCLTSNTSSLAEVGGDAAMCIDPENVDAIAAGLEQLVFDVSLRTNLTEKGVARAATFQWQNTAKAVMEAVEKVARTGRDT